jgi:hypothetical protein
MPDKPKPDLPEPGRSRFVAEIDETVVLGWIVEVGGKLPLLFHRPEAARQAKDASEALRREEEAVCGTWPPTEQGSMTGRRTVTISQLAWPASSPRATARAKE